MPLLIYSNPSLPSDEFHLILTLGLPPKNRVQETTPWISLACNIADVLYSRAKLLPDVQIPKLVRRFLPLFFQLADSQLSDEQRKRRAEALEVFTKALDASKKLSAQEQKEELAAKRLKVEKEREEEKLKGMSKAERVKYLVSSAAGKNDETEGGRDRELIRNPTGQAGGTQEEGGDEETEGQGQEVVFIPQGYSLYLYLGVEKCADARLRRAQLTIAH